MKKRMIAWLLCACMTLTAAPEMLLADVAGKLISRHRKKTVSERKGLWKHRLQNRMMKSRQ